MILRLMTKKGIVLSLLMLTIVVCISVVLIVMVETKENPCDYNCSLEDINGKFDSGVYFDAIHKNISDQMTLILYFDRELSYNEILQIEQLGLKIDTDSWLPAPTGGGSYVAKCKVESICKLACSNLVKRVLSGETIIEPDTP